MGADRFILNIISVLTLTRIVRSRQWFGFTDSFDAAMTGVLIVVVVNVASMLFGCFLYFGLKSHVPGRALHTAGSRVARVAEVRARRFVRVTAGASDPWLTRNRPVDPRPARGEGVGTRWRT